MMSRIRFYLKWLRLMKLQVDALLNAQEDEWFIS